MIEKATVFLFLLCSMTWAYADYHPKPEETWPLVAKAEVIVTGTLSVPVQEIRKCQSSNKHAYVDLKVKRDQVIKGDVPEEFVVKCSTEPAHYSPDPERVILLDGQQVMLFLYPADDKSGRKFHFAGSSPQALVESDKQLEK